MSPVVVDDQLIIVVHLRAIVRRQTEVVRARLSDLYLAVPRSDHILLRDVGDVLVKLLGFVKVDVRAVRLSQIVQPCQVRHVLWVVRRRVETHRPLGLRRELRLLGDYAGDVLLNLPSVWTGICGLEPLAAALVVVLDHDVLHTGLEVYHATLLCVGSLRRVVDDGLPSDVELRTVVGLHADGVATRVDNLELPTKDKGKRIVGDTRNKPPEVLNTSEVDGRDLDFVPKFLQCPRGGWRAGKRLGGKVHLHLPIARKHQHVLVVCVGSAPFQLERCVTTAVIPPDLSSILALREAGGDTFLADVEVDQDAVVKRESGSVIGVDAELIGSLLLDIDVAVDHCCDVGVTQSWHILSKIVEIVEVDERDFSVRHCRHGRDVRHSEVVRHAVRSIDFHGPC
mmetsp:Transcript_33574/g.105736  ORF Transcript_33574/g.105736 Transcript_33574/m.105736 type:complete len:397 (-) Transcript_33574:1078-2268(-)